MPIERSILDETARRYVAQMTSIRGRRVYRLLMREFSRFDYVLEALAEGGAPALVALRHGGAMAVCCTDGRGRSATIARAAGLQGGAVVTAYDLLKDSLPIAGWTVRHQGFATVGGTITIDASGMTDADRGTIDTILSRVETEAGDATGRQ